MSDVRPEQSVEVKIGPGADPPSLRFDPRLLNVLRRFGVGVELRDERHVVFTAVPVTQHNKPRTNLLLRREPGGAAVYVDIDLQPLDTGQAAHDGGVCKWRKLASPPVSPDPQRGLSEILPRLGSPMAGPVQTALQQCAPTRPTGANGLGPTLAAYTRPIPQCRLDAALASCVRPDLAERIAITTTRRESHCPVLWSAAPGCGLDLMLHAAAAMLLQRGLAVEILETSGAELAAGRMHWQELDGDLRRLLDELTTASDRVLLVRQLELGSTGSWPSHSVLVEALDRGVRMMATVKSAASLRRFRDDPSLARRLAPIQVPSMSRCELLAALEDAAAASPVDVSAAALRTAMSRTAGAAGAGQPAAALTLLESAIADVVWRCGTGRGVCVLPDDVSAAVPGEWPHFPTEQED